MGLAIARQIVTAHHGTLDYTSTVGKGTSFFVSLPVLPPNAPVSAAS
jgi:signal transduction histidine kinase